MTQEQKSIPKWILIVSGLLAAMSFMVSATLCFSPESSLQTVDLNAKGVDFLIYMWASRQFAVGFIFGLAIWKKSIPMLTIAYTFILVMNIGDCLNGVLHNDSSLYLGAGLICIIASTMIYFINKQSK